MPMHGHGGQATGGSPHGDGEQPLWLPSYHPYQAATDVEKMAELLHTPVEIQDHPNAVDLAQVVHGTLTLTT